MRSRCRNNLRFNAGKEGGRNVKKWNEEIIRENKEKRLWSASLPEAKANGIKMEVQIVRSRRRKRTVSARVVEDTLLVQAPLALSGERLGKIIADFKSRFERRKIKEALDRREDLKEVAAGLNEKYFGNKLKINSIQYVTGQNSRFGCCHYRTANIRISHRIGAMPAWVRDYVLIHEMAHLIEPNHSKAFWDMVSRYRLAERARGFMMAAALNRDTQQKEARAR